ncbi:cell envelope integrity protein TolA [Arsenophonus endosymbiont of Aphis craccivora]|uniref:cell envelope integrity protein TolA n=1 Tax=Arsenophonus endosymbiont of Aphis craccivora TaxID=1231049 RepID=UPI0015DBFF3F|nr:cell envelope integrity protein TolA [Arsenophonus endosymbiont of Aphis craccivora]QLK87456.1 cell envelope integrity protein TolA [Arsenophonus endosymbiont of Aphis craccivora]
MIKTKEQKNKLSCSVVLSIIFHVLLFGFIILGSLDEIIKLGGGGQGGEVVDAIMVDPSVVIEQYNQLQRQQNSAKHADTERKKRLQQQEEELRKQQEEEQKRLKMVEEERIKIAREAEQQRKQAEDAAQKAKKQQKIAEEAAAKAKAEQERLIKEQAEAKEKAEKAAKALAAKKKADAAKQAATVDSLLGGLTAQQPTQQMGGAAAAGQGGNRKSGASSSDVANYAGKIKAAIESKFYDADIYRGKTCELSIKLAPDGMLISIAAKSNTANDQPLCEAAIRAAKTATMPKPPSRSIYDAFNEQGSTLVFQPSLMNVMNSIRLVKLTKVFQLSGFVHSPLLIFKLIITDVNT